MSVDRSQVAQVLLFVTPALWCVNYWVARTAPGHIEPHALALSRWGIALFLMLPFAWGELSRQWPSWRKEWKDLLLLGACGMWVCGAFVYIGARTTSAINMSLLYSVSPVLIALVSATWFHEKLTKLQWLGAAMACGGMLFVISKGRFLNLVNMRFTSGDWWIVAAVIAWTIYSLMLQNRKSCLGAFSRSVAITLGGVMLLIPLTAAEMFVVGLPSSFDGTALVLAVTAAIFPGFLAYQAYSFMQKELGAARTGLVLYLGPLYAAAMAWLFLNEQPQLFHAIGALLILPGIYLASKK
jgi:drug/metabolite transporter (DMT)-like permease